MSNPMHIGRLALRQEGDNLNAYWAEVEGLKDAIYLGSIRTGAVAHNRDRVMQFLRLMQDVLGDIIEEKTGVRPDWSDPVEAPINEISGHA